jgi:Ca2+-binding RTX toxin-like protein
MAPRRQVRRSRCENVALELLESRLPLTASAVGLDPLNGTLSIRCNDTDSAVVLRLTTVGSGVAAFQRIAVVEGGRSLGSWPLAAVSRVEFTGGLRNDSFDGSAASKPMTLLGNDGTDVLVGGRGRNTIDGGNGNDSLRAVGASVFYGQDGNDRIIAGNGDDTIEGNGGNDIIDAGGGSDDVFGGAGNDTVNAGAGNDRVWGEDGNDGLVGGDGDDTIEGGGGIDGISGNDGLDTLRGGADADVLSGGDGADTIWGDGGSDTLAGDEGNDTIHGGTGDDTIRGLAGLDALDGGDGADSIAGGTGDDSIVGGAGNDRIWGEAGLDTLDGQDGDDAIRGGASADTIRGGRGDDSLDGEAGEDRIFGGAGYDSLRGGPGRDLLNGGDHLDTLDGGGGDDWLVAIDDFGLDSLTGGTGKDSFWRDLGAISSDLVTDLSAADADHGVLSFANPGADRTLDGDAIAGPAFTAGLATASFAGSPLFSSFGPRGTDINQGLLSDSKVVAGLAALTRDTAADNGWAVRRSIVDFGDGTYGVHLGANFYRVDAVLPLAAGSTTPNYARLGAENSIWVSIAEKAIALADQRTPGSPNYADLTSTGADEVFAFFGSAATGVPVIRTSYASAAALGSDIVRRFRAAAPQYLTVSLSDTFTGSLYRKFAVGHTYTVWALNFNGAGGLASVVLRNPWGVDTGILPPVSYRDANPNDGLVTITVAELWSSSGRLDWATRVS